MIDNLKNTIENLAENNFNIDLLGRQWYDVKNKIDSLLLSGKRDVERVKKLTDQLYQLSFSDRRDFVKKNFGPRYYDKVEPLLYQLETIETAYNK